MVKNLLSFGVLSVLVISASAFIRISSSGIAGVTGSPGESNCSGCHGGGGGATTVSISAIPAFTSNEYIPGQTYTVEVDVTNASFTKFGFGCEILTTTNTNAGTMTTALTGVKFLNSGARKNAVHTTPKTGTGTASFQFVWTAPASGTVKIYAAGNAVNGNGSTNGDTPGSSALTLTASPTAVAEVSQDAASGLVVYPNPVGSQLRMQYNLNRDGLVKATLFDLRGQEVHTLLSERQAAGIHSPAGELPADLAPGIYMLKLQVNGEPSAQRLVIKQ